MSESVSDVAKGQFLKVSAPRFWEVYVVVWVVAEVEDQLLLADAQRIGEDDGDFADVFQCFDDVAAPRIELEDMSAIDVCVDRVDDDGRNGNGVVGGEFKLVGEGVG